MSSIRNPDGIWINTECFREEAKRFDKEGRYCKAPVSWDPYSDYQVYWKEQNRRCIEGYEVGGVKITGDHYNYLNFNQIKLTAKDNEEEKVTKQLVRSKGGKKRIFFPDFWDGDYDYFWTKEIAQHGISLKDYQKLKLGINIHEEDLCGGLHITVGKARRKGFSFKNGSIVANKYKREPNSISLVVAYLSDFLYPSGTMSMVIDYLNFYNKYTAWSRRTLSSSDDFWKDGYKIKNEFGVWEERGFLSQVLALTANNNPDIARGKDGTLVLAEEAGKWPTLQAFLNSTKPTLKSGSITTGLLMVFGTGGGDNINWQEFEKVFYYPELNNMIRIENIWDNNARGTYCGYFHSELTNMDGFVDKHGNSLRIQAKEYHDTQINKIAKIATDPKSLIDYKMEHATKPSEAFSISSSNVFPVAELDDQRRRVEVHELWKSGIAGEIKEIGGDLKFEPNSSLQPIRKFESIKKPEDAHGAIVQYRPPYRVNGKVPDNLYIICLDQYDFETSTTLESLGAAYIIMNPNNIVPNEPGDIIVASYIGRPASPDIFNFNLFQLARYYNAKIGAENDRGSMMDFVKRNTHLRRYVESEFDLPWKDEMGLKMNNSLGRGYGMSMAGGKDNMKKKYGDLFIRDWLLRVRYTTPDGRVVRNLHFIYDLGLLEEMKRYGEGNYDRVAALRIGMYHMKELLYKNIKVALNQNDSISTFFKTKLCA